MMVLLKCCRVLRDGWMDRARQFEKRREEFEKSGGKVRKIARERARHLRGGKIQSIVRTKQS